MIDSAWLMMSVELTVGVGGAGGLVLPTWRLAQDDKKIAEIPPRINLRNVCVGAVVLFKSGMAFVRLGELSST